MRKILVLLAVILVAQSSRSQGTLRGRILDSATAKPLGLATITVFKATDTTIITYRLSNNDGEFRIPGIPLDTRCRAVISYSGYAVCRKEFSIAPTQTTMELDTIRLSSDAKSLDEVLVMAERPPVVIKKDTIEFNASAFKTLPNALVEDLLRKLPGVYVDKDGNIAVNGKPVNRILVDGKTFFGDDPKMATRNLPAHAIDKVQVTDDKEEMMRNGDDNPNNVGKVVNITLKKGIKKGWFGKLYAGAGPENLYEVGGIANIYRDTLQLSMLAYMNNLNKVGFSYSELQQTGGFGRVQSNSASSSTTISSNNGGSSISINGINFGGSQSGGGISTSKGAGFNLNHAPNNKQSLFLQYFHGNVLSDRVSSTDFLQYNADTVIRTYTGITGDFITSSHMIGAGARLKPDSLTNILFNANYLLGIQDEDRLSDITGTSNITGPLSNGNLDQFNDAKTYNYKHGLYITLLSGKKKGRRFNLTQSLDINNRQNDYQAESDIRYFYPATFDSIYAQLRKERIPRTDALLSFNYSDPLSKSLTLRLGGRYEYSRLTNSVSTFNRSVNGKFEILNNLLSSDFRRTGHRSFLTAGLEYKLKNVTLTPGVRVLDQHVNNKLLSTGTGIKQNQFNVLPSFTASYKQLTVNYNRDVNLPGFSSLNPVRDISNPYFIFKGNPDLLSSIRDNISLNLFFNDSKRFLSVSGWINAAYTQRDVVNSIQLNAAGVQESMPVNANGSRNYSMNWNINKQYKNKQNIIVMWNTGNWLGVNKSRLFFNGTSSWQTTFNYSHWNGAGINFKDKVEWNVSYGFNRNFTKYTGGNFRELKVKSYNMGTDLTVRWPKHFIWETQVNYSYNSSIPAGLPKELLRWSAALNLTMLKNEAAVIKFAVNDILNRNNNIWVNAMRNTITTTQSNILGRYFLLTFTYNVRPAGVKKKVGGRESLFYF